MTVGVPIRDPDTGERRPVQVATEDDVKNISVEVVRGIADEIEKRVLESLSRSAVVVDETFTLVCVIDGDGNANAVMAIKPVNQPDEWSVDDTEVQCKVDGVYKVEITAHAEYVNRANTSAMQRISPELVIEASTDRDRWAALATSLTGYQRHANGHKSSSNHVSYCDLESRAYRVSAKQGGDQNDTLPITNGYVVFTAHRKTKVISVG